MNDFKAALNNNTLDDDSFNSLFFMNIYQALNHFVQESYQFDDFCEFLFRKYSNQNSFDENLFDINKLIKLAIKNKNNYLLKGFFLLKYCLFTRKFNLKLNTFNEVNQIYEYQFMSRYQDIESLMGFKLTKEQEDCLKSFKDDNKKEQFFDLAAEYSDKQDTFEILMDLQLVESVNNPLKIATLSKNCVFIETFLAKANLDTLIQEIKYKLQGYNDENFFDHLEQKLSQKTIIYPNIKEFIFKFNSLIESKNFKKVLVDILYKLIEDYFQLKNSFIDCYNSEDLIRISTASLECFQILFHIDYSVTESDLLKHCLENKHYDTFKYLINEFKQLNGITNTKSKKLLEMINWKDNKTPSILHFVLDQFERNEINYEEVKTVYNELFQLETIETHIFSSLFFKDQNILIKVLSKKESHVFLKYFYEDKVFINSSFNSKIKNDIKILFNAIENCNSKNTIFYLLKIYKAKLNVNNESPIDLLIQLKDPNNSSLYLFDNKTIKQIIDIKESNLKFKLNHKSFQELCSRNDTNLMKIYLENSDFNHEEAKFSVCFNTVIKNDRQKMAEMIASHIRDHNNKHLNSSELDFANCIVSNLIDYDSLKEILIVKKWWNVIELLLDCTNLTPKIQRAYNEQIIRNMNMKTFFENKPLEEKFCFSFLDYWKSTKQVITTSKNNQYTSIPIEDNDLKSVNILPIDDHPLILIAKSGQKALIKHPSTLKYLELKWQGFPFLFYYIYTILQVVFMISFSWCTYERIKSATKATEFDHYLSGNKTGDAGGSPGRSSLFFFSWVLINLIFSGILFLYEIFQWLVFEGFFKYFNSIKNILELITYSLSTIILIRFLLISQIPIKTDDFVYYLTPICVLFGYLVLILCLEKMSLFGIYIVAFRESFKKIFKLLPIIVFLFIGFILAFKLNTMKMNKGFINSTGLESVSRLSSLILSNLDPEKFEELGLDKMAYLTNYLSSYFIFFLFVLLMPVLLINLLLAVSIDEFKTILKDAEIMQYQMRIEYTIKIRMFLFKFCCSNTKKNFNYKLYDSEINDTFIAKVRRFFHNLYEVLKINLKNGIGFVDKSENKLEDNLRELNKGLKLEIDSSRDYLTNQIADHGSKINELSDFFESVKDSLGDKIEKVHVKLNENDQNIKDEKSINGKTEQFDEKLLALDEKLNSIKATFENSLKFKN